MPQVVTGLLRTEAYVQGITVASFPAAPDDFTERAVVRRLGRQHLLARPKPPGGAAVAIHLLRPIFPAQPPSSGLIECRQTLTSQFL